MSGILPPSPEQALAACQSPQPQSQPLLDDSLQLQVSSIFTVVVFKSQSVISWSSLVHGERDEEFGAMVTFNSVGDIISVSLLIKDLALALDASKGAAAEYQEVTRELHVLDIALLEVERLARTHEATPELQALCEIARRSVDKSRICVNNFTERIKKYSSSLAEAEQGTRSSMRQEACSGSWGEMRWIDSGPKLRATVMPCICS